MSHKCQTERNRKSLVPHRNAPLSEPVVNWSIMPDRTRSVPAHVNRPDQHRFNGHPTSCPAQTVRCLRLARPEMSTEFRGGHPHMSPECSREMALIRETGREGDVDQGSV